MNSKRRLARGAGAGFAALAISACTMIGHERVSDWPQLAIVEHHVAHAEMRSHCARYAGFGMSPEACAEFNFAQARCDVWYSADFPPPRLVVEHERLHCRGYDHVGEASLSLILARYRAAQRLAGLSEASSGGTSQ
jgi:hypothetical protein